MNLGSFFQGSTNFIGFIGGSLEKLMWLTASFSSHFLACGWGVIHKSNCRSCSYVEGTSTCECIHVWGGYLSVEGTFMRRGCSYVKGTFMYGVNSCLRVFMWWKNTSLISGRDAQFALGGIQWINIPLRGIYGSIGYQKEV